MSKLMLDLESFKALSSDTRLLILKALDGKRLGLNDLTKETKLSKATLYEHLTKLSAAGLIKKKQRPGHKWVYYKLSWKGSSLLHPENTRVLLLFTSTFAALTGAIIGIYTYLQTLTSDPNQERMFYAQNDSPLKVPLETGGELSTGGSSPFFLSIAIICTIIFIGFLSVSIWRYQKNKKQKL